MPAPGKYPQRDWQVERSGLLGQFCWGEVDHHAVLWADVTAVDRGPFDAVRTFTNRRFGQANQDCLGNGRSRNVHFRHNGQGLDANQAKRVNSREHKVLPHPQDGMYTRSFEQISHQVATSF